MKVLVGTLIVMITLLFLGCSQEENSPNGQVLEKVFTHDGLERDYLLYLPDGTYKDGPLVFVFHGYTSTNKDLLDDADFKALADANDFVICYPQGLKDNFGINHWNANLKISDVDDLGFIKNLADALVDEYDLDENRVFATGMSNGDFMSYTLALKASDTFRAIASVAGLMSGQDWQDRKEAVAMPVLHIHGMDDNVVLPDGKMSTRGGWGGAPSVDKIVEFWADVNGCENKSTEEISDAVTVTKYINGIENNEVWYYSVQGLAHEWPIKDLNTDFNATDLIWAFFSQYK